MKEMKMNEWESEMENQFDAILWEVCDEEKEWYTIWENHEEEIVNAIAKKYGKDILKTKVFDEWYTDNCEDI